MRAEMIVIPTVFGLLAYTILKLLRNVLDHIHRTRTSRYQSELYSKMLEKFGSSHDFLGYLQSEAGQKLLLAPPAVAERPAHGRILNSVQLGIVLLVAGVGVIGASTMLHGGDQEPALVIGMLVASIGIGLLASGAVSYTLSKRLGLINGTRSEVQ